MCERPKKVHILTDMSYSYYITKATTLREVARLSSYNII